MSVEDLIKGYLPNWKMDDHNLTESQRIIGKLGLNKSLIFLLKRANQQESPKEAYGSILRGLAELYHSLQSDQGWSGDASWHLIVQKLILACRQLDEDCGTDLKPMIRGLSKSEEASRLQKLDQDREQFKKYLTDHLKNSCSTDYPAVRETLLYFAELLFMFNGYQAPYRTCPQKAAEDAAGLTDLFTELLVEIEGK